MILKTVPPNKVTTSCFGGLRWKIALQMKIKSNQEECGSVNECCSLFFITALAATHFGSLNLPAALHGFVPEPRTDWKVPAPNLCLEMCTDTSNWWCFFSKLAHQRWHRGVSRAVSCPVPQVPQVLKCPLLGKSISTENYVSCWYSGFKNAVLQKPT